MTNDGMTNDEWKTRSLDGLFRHSAFVIDSSFVIPSFVIRSGSLSGDTYAA